MMGFYQNVFNTYGMETTKLMKQWHSSTIKLARLINRKNYLTRCRRHNITPTHIHNATKKVHALLATTSWNIGRSIGEYIVRLEIKIRNLEIKITYNDMSKFNNSIHSIKSKLKKLIPLDIFNKYSDTLKSTFKKEFLKVKQSNKKKFDKLHQYCCKLNKPFINNEKWFRNISDIAIPQDVADFLSLGPKFGIPVVGDDVNYKQLLADVEAIIDVIPDEVNNKDSLRAKITNNITNFIHCPREVSPYCQVYKKTKAFLKSNPELYILQADKGAVTVAMSKKEYIEKTETLLKDMEVYQKINKDPTYNIQLKHNKLIKEIKQKNEITEIVAKQLTIYNSVISKLYCCPKIHKRDVPLRPIVSSIGSTTYQLSKFLSIILKDSFYHRTDYNIKDTFSFVTEVNHRRLPQDFVLISLDVVSLFTSIPMELVKQIIIKNWQLIEPRTSMTKESFVKIFSFVCDNCFFSFNNVFYHQISGTPMGLPISPIIAHIVMDYLLDAVLEKLPFDVPFIYKYVDDIICAVPKDKIDTTLNIFNQFDSHLQFTVEEETDNSIPFLDTLLIRTNENKIILNWYQKPTSSGRYINFYSNHPMNQKYNTIIAMKNRVSYISDTRFLKSNLKKLFDDFVNNGYPKYLLHGLIYHTNQCDGQTEDAVDDTLTYNKLPYIKYLSDNIISHFKQYKNIKIAKYNSITTNDIFTKTKDKTPFLSVSGVVYRVPCQNCARQYIGQTTQTLKQRITQHKSDIRIGKRSCALSNHVHDQDHTFDFNKVEILEREKNLKKRLFLEMVHINAAKESINSRSDIDQLSVIYCNILDKVSKNTF